MRSLPGKTKEIQKQFYSSKHKSLMSWFLREGPKIKKQKDTFQSPANGKVISCGKIERDKIFYAPNKKIKCSISQLVGKLDDKYIDGEFCNIYLSPLNYHYFISPLDMKVSKVKYIPGKLKTVSEKAQNKIDTLFIKNERYIIECQANYHGKNVNFIMIPIGAIGVSAIYLNCFKDSIKNIVSRTLLYKKLKQKTVSSFAKKMFDPQTTTFKALDKLGMFLFGSTVVILSERNSIKFNKKLIGKEIQLGDQLD